MTLTHGVDVHPRYQTVDWPNLDPQVEFVITKLTEGKGLLSWQADGVNESHVYVAKTREARRLAGGYHLCHPENNTAAVEAAFYAGELDAVGWKSGRDLPPILDVEPFLFTKHNLTGAFVADWSLQFCRLIDDHYGLTDPWLRCGFYEGASIFSYLDPQAVAADRWFWHGGYGATEWPTQMPSRAAIYQKVNKPITLVAGISGGDLDIDVAAPETLRSLAPLFYGAPMAHDPLDTADVHKILYTDNEIKAPPSDPSVAANPYWAWWAHVQRTTEAALYGIPKRLDELATKEDVAALKLMLDTIAADVKALRALLPGE